MRVEHRSRDLEFRVSVLPTLWGEKIVMRLLDKSKLMLDMTKLGFEPHSLERFRNALAKPYGMVLITGPTGSGKTNTLYSAIAALNKADTNIMTAEDRVEFDIPGINQVRIRENVGLSFAAALRSIVQQDPNIIAVDEIRDDNTAVIALRIAALARYLVLACLTDTDTPSAVESLTKATGQPFVFGRAVRLVVAQRLVRRICAKCKVEISAEVPPKTLSDIGFTPEEIEAFQVLTGKGCPSCNGTGYRGRVGLFEVMEITEGVRDLIMVGAPAVEIQRKALEEGMLTLRMSGLEKVKQGITTLEEVLRETVA
jgi:type IV pilus assembly protein PilB